jgi:hypothetical protein
MRPFCLVLTCLLLGSPLWASSSGPEATEKDAATVLTISELGRGTAALDGKWQFRLGDDVGWAAPAYNDSAWQQITADQPWGQQGHPSQTGFGWYRRHLKVTPAVMSGSKFAILIPPVDDAYELYWNGVKFGALGSVPPNGSWQVGHRQSFELPISAGVTSDGVLAIRVWKAPLSSFDPDTLGGLNAPPVIGDAASIAARIGARDFERMRGRQYARAISLVFLLAGAVSLFAWLRNRNQWLFLWFGILSLDRVLVFHAFSDPMITRFSSSIIYGVLQVLLSIVDCSIFLLLLYLFELQDSARIRRWTWIMVGINFSFFFVDGLVSLPWANAGLTLQWVDAILTAVVTLSELFVFVLVYQGMKRKLDPARKLVAVIAFLDYVYGILRISTSQGARFTHWTLADKLNSPLFHLAGANITTQQLLDTLLLLSVAYALVRFSAEQRKQRAAIEMELKSARELQQVLIPEELPEVAGYAIASVYRPAQEVGGDFFQIIPLEDNSTLVILGDVSGKGLKAAMNVSLIVGTLRTLAEFDSNPASILTGLNRRLIGRLQGGFVTTLVFKLDHSGQCTLANAGHLEPFLNRTELKVDGSLPLGMVADAEYQQQSFTLSEGDRLTLYTDGVLEARNGQRQLYGFDRMRALLGSDPTAETIAETARAFGQEDDITVLTIHRLTRNEPSRAATINLVPGLVPA